MLESATAEEDVSGRRMETEKGWATRECGEDSVREHLETALSSCYTKILGS
jgi:hypothetical protein